MINLIAAVMCAFASGLNLANHDMGWFVVEGVLALINAAIVLSEIA